MYLDDKPHPDWEMAPKTQRKFSLGVAAVVILVVLINLLGAPGPSMWDHDRPYAQNVFASD
jgi:hypothetical protein